MSNQAGRTMIKYLGSFTNEGREFDTELWNDEAKNRYLWRIASPRTGAVVRTFTSEWEMKDYIKTLKP